MKEEIYNKDGILFFEDGYWFLDAEPYVTTLFQRLFPSSKEQPQYGWDKTKSKFKFTHRPRKIQDLPIAKKDINWFISRFDLIISDADRRRLKNGAQDYDSKLKQMKLSFQNTQIDLQLKLPLRDYQKQAVSLALSRNSLLIADQVGLGKTPTAIGIASKALPCLCIVPPHLVTQWEEEIHKFIPSARVHKIMTGKEYELPESDFYINAYSRIAKWSKVFTKDLTIKTLVMDEIHNLRNSDTDKYNATRDIAEKAVNKIGLSATPVMNYGIDIFNIFSILEPNTLGDKVSFNREWCQWGSVTDPELLGNFLRKNLMMVRRTRTDVKVELDPVQRTIYDVDADIDTLKNFEKEAKALAMKVLLGDFNESGQASRELDWKLRQITGVAKARAVAEIVKVIIQSGEKVVLFGWHREVYDIWLKELQEYNPVMFTGSESIKQKNESLKQFKNGISSVFIMSLRSGAGLNGLQEVSSYAVFGELDWSPGIIDQCIGRLWRDGQQSVVSAVFVTINDGADPHMKEVIGLKSAEAHKILNPESKPNVLASGGENKISDLARKYLESKGEDVERILEKKKRDKEEGILIQAPTLGHPLYDLFLTLKALRVQTLDEKKVQHEIAEQLTQAGYSYQREVRITKQSIPDFILPGEIIIECKTKNFSKPELLRQIKRYKQDYRNVRAIFVITPQVINHFNIDGIPVYAINFSDNSLLQGGLS